MKYLKSTSLLLLLLSLLLTLSHCSPEKSEIRQAVDIQLKRYPESTLQDIYKSFLQDEFGPGHMLNDLDVAKEYFDLELEDMVSRGRHDAEPCGAGKYFVRVPMDLVKDGLIREEDFFNAFVESSKNFQKPDLAAWKEKWEMIDKVVKRMNLKLPDYERDKKMLQKIIERGEPVIHHSERFDKAYDPHYRIMSLPVWEELKRKSSVVSRRSSVVGH